MLVIGFSLIWIFYNTEMVEQYAPNFMAMINADEKLKKDVYNDDGVMVGFGTIIVNEARREKAM